MEISLYNVEYIEFDESDRFAIGLKNDKGSRSMMFVAETCRVTINKNNNGDMRLDIEYE